MLRKLSYRPDIDGLRALAVISVILFHINPDYMPSGFLGVDIFFVISGFLITSIIYREMAEGTFSFANFYNRRIKRILPVFFVVLIVGLLVVWWLFLGINYYGIANSAIASILFLSNIYFSRGGGYFDMTTKELPFNHIWSLSVEEQFYFIFPFLLLLIFKNKYLKRKKIITLLVGGGILLLLSFIDLKNIGIDLDVYYLSHLRMIELLVGSILSIILFEKGNSLSKRQSDILGIFSFIGLLICLYLNDFFIFPYFPGILSLLPCISVAMLILANEKGVWVKQLFSLQPIVWIGKLSYSLYLWHWLVLAEFKYFVIGDISFISGLIIFALMFFLSILTYYFVEQPFRHKIYTLKKSFLLFYLLPSSIVLLICYKLYTASIPDAEKIFDHYPPMECRKCNGVKDSLTVLGDKNTTNSKEILFAGDSFTSHFAPFIEILGRKEGWKAHIISAGGCPFLFDMMNYEDFNPKFVGECKEMNDFLEKNYQKYNIFVFSCNYPGQMKTRINFLKRLEKTIDKLLSNGKKVYVVNTSFEFDEYLLRSVKFKEKTTIDISGRFKREEYEKSVESWNEMQTELHRFFPNISIIDLTAYIPDDGMIEGKPIILDTNHWNAYGAKKIAEQFIKDGKRLIREEDLK